MSDFYNRSIGAPPHTFRLTDEGVDLDAFEPGWYWVLLNADEQHMIEVVVGDGDVHGIWCASRDGDLVRDTEFVAMAELDPGLFSAWAGPLPDPGWDSQFPELNCGDVDRFPPTERAAATGCTGAGEAGVDLTWLYTDVHGWRLYTDYGACLVSNGLRAPAGCTSLDAVQAGAR